jgi:hypothetical protein
MLLFFCPQSLSGLWAYYNTDMTSAAPKRAFGHIKAQGQRHFRTKFVFVTH